MVLRNYLDKVKRGFLIGLTALSFYALPIIAQTQENKKSELETKLENSDEDSTKQDSSQITRIKAKEEHYIDHSFLSNFNTYQIGLEAATRGRILDYVFGFGVGIKKQGKTETDVLVNFSLSRESYFGRNISINPYIMFQIGLDNKHAMYQMEKIKNPDAKPDFFYQNNISFGLKLKKDLSKELSLGFNFRQINYFDKKAKRDLVFGILVGFP